MAKICIGIPTAESIKTQTVLDLFELTKRNNIDKVIVKQSALVHTNRETIVLDALKTDCTHLLFLDSDMSFGSLILEKLIAHDKDIVGLIYYFKTTEGRPVVYMDERKPLDKNNIPRKLFKCHAIGTGCLLIKLSVFEKIERPWFFFEESCGEDIYFCEKAHKSGFDIWCDGMLEIKHIGEYKF